MPETTNHQGLGEVTRLLQQVREGDRAAFDRLFPLIYNELKRIARGQLRRERPGHTLHPTALVHEAYLKLADQPVPEWQTRAHFFGIAARAMRQILIDHARKHCAARRGGDAGPASVSVEKLGLDVPLEELLALDEALDRLDKIDPRLRQVVEYRFFAGLTEAEAAEVLGVTERTVQREWVKARAWLYKELYRQGE